MAHKNTKLTTVSERILLYLTEYKSYTDEIDGPLELTQIGIGNAVGVARKNVGSITRQLIEDGYVESHPVHVSGIRLKRSIYYLTGPGFKEAMKLKTKIGNTEIQIVYPDGESTNTRLDEAINEIPFEIRYIDIIRGVNKMRIFDCQAFLKNQRYGAVDPSSHLRKKSGLEHFHGREKEEKTASRWFNSTSSHTLVIKGMAGIGKSTFMLRIMDEMSEPSNIYFYRIQPWTTKRAILKSMSRFFEDMGINELSGYLAGSESFDMSELEYLFMGCLSNTKKLMMVFDDFHHANNDIQTMFAMFHRSVTAAENVKLMVAGRTINPFYDIHDIALRKNVIEIVLYGLDEESTIALARDVGISTQFIDSIFAHTGGHPLFVELLGNGATPDMNKDIEKFINDEFIQTLDGRELELLKYLSVFRYPIHREGLPGFQKVLSRLIEQSIIKQSENDFIELHDIIKTTLYRRLSEEEMKSFHSRAAEYYIEDFSMNGMLEVLHHLLIIDRCRDAVDLILDKQEQLLKSDKMQELARTLAIILVKSADIDKQEKARLLYIQGRALAFTGEWDDAIMHYDRAVVIAGDNEKLEMRSKSGIAEISLMRNNYSVALSLFGDVFKWADKNNDIKIKAEASYQLGTGHERLGHNELALKYFNESLKYSFKTYDRHQMAKAYYGQGRIFHRRREYEKALENKNKALDIALKIDNKHIASKILTSIGNTLDELGRSDEEIKTHEKAIELARESGAVRALAYALSNAGAAYLDIDELDKSMKYLEEAADIFEKLGEQDMFATTILNKAIIALYKGYMDMAISLFNECKNILKALDNDIVLMDSYYRFGLAHKKIGCLDETLSYLNKALAVSREIGDEGASRQINLEISQISE